MTRSTVEKRLDLAVDRAVPHCRSLQNKHISPHTIRHTVAMHLLQSGVAFNIIALWLGHVLCLFRAVTIRVVSPQWLSGFQRNLAA
jgi:site-specific recombinase XerD